MPQSRRHFVSSVGAASVCLPLLSTLGCNSGEESVPRIDPEQGEAFDKDVYEFWTKEAVRFDAHDSPAFSGSGKPEFVYYNGSTFQELTAQEEEAKKVLPDKGDVKIQARVARFRPSTTDIQRFKDLKSGTLRVDISQGEAQVGIAERLAWTAIGALLPDQKGNIPKLEDLNFDPNSAWGGLKDTPLPAGLGHWNWNFFVQKKDSPWARVIAFFKKTAPGIATVLGLPAIAVAGLSSLGEFMGNIIAQSQTEWIFRSQPFPVYGTKAARSTFPGEGLPLRSGNYIVVDQAHLGAFSKEFSNLALQRELIVPKGTAPGSAFDAAADVLKDMSYLSVSVRATHTS